MPAEQITMYFHEASSAPSVRRWPTRNVVVIVVASTATHITPRLAARTAISMQAVNAWTSAVYSAACRGLHAPRAVWSDRYRADWQEASSAIAPMTTTMNALSASARSTPPGAVTGWCRVTQTASADPMTRTAPLAAAASQLIQPIQRRHGVTAAAAAPVTGTARMR